MRRYPSTISIVLVCVFLVGRVEAQPTNAEVVQQLAMDCLRPALGGVDSVTVVPDGRHPFLRPALIGMLRAEGAAVFLGDSLASRAHAHSLRYVVRGASVSYRKSTSDNLDRTVNLELEFTLLTDERQVLLDSLCTRDYSDTIARSDLDVVEDSTLAISTGKAPRKGFLRRIAEPAVVAAAAAVAVYLFFNVRSDSNESQ